MADTVAENLTKMFRFKNAKIMFDYSNVSALSTNDAKKEDLRAKKIENYGKLYSEGLIFYNTYLTEIGQKTVEWGDQYIYDLNKVPYSTKLGVGGTQALQGVLIDQTMTPEVKKQTLIIVFGFSEEEASKLTMANNQ